MWQCFRICSDCILNGSFVSQTINTDSQAQVEQAEFLCADLDGTLLEVDSLWESLLALLGAHPWTILLIPFWLLKGKAVFKQEIGRRAPINVSTLPLREDVVEFLREEKQNGRKLILVTAADRSIATAVASRVGLFDAVLASDGITNLAGAKKVSAIQAFLGGKAFDYIADSTVDLPVWTSARTAILVGPTAELLEIARKTLRVGKVFARRENRWSALWNALRPQHWVKNLLVFVPLVMAHDVADSVRLTRSLLAFASFSLCASAVYVLNDLFDLESDRLHHTKRKRPFASGAVPLWAGFLVAPLLAVASVFVAAHLSRLFLVEIAVYAIAAMLYSTYGKRIPMLDVLLLTGLYLLRILGGGAATDIPVSPWLLAFSMFLLLSLAFAKRYMELVGQVESDQPNAVSKRNYFPRDADLVRELGVASGYLSVLVLALYVNGREVAELYRQPQWIWLACPLLLFWISRVWFLANRGVLHEDPVVFAVRDLVSYALGFIILLILYAAS